MTIQTAYTGLASIYDALMDSKEREAWITSTLEILRKYGVMPGDEVIDLACGTGAISIPLARAGYRVTAIDLSEDMLMEAQRKARGVSVRWLLGDMTSFRTHRPVKAINIACDGINYLTDLNSVRACFNSASNALLPKGMLVFDVSTPKKLNGMDKQLYSLDDEDITYIWRNQSEEDHVLKMDITFFRKRPDGLFERFDELHRQRAHSMEELEDCLSSAGLKIREKLSGLSEACAEKEDLRWRIIAEKI